MTVTQASSARLALRGHEPTPATVDLVYQPRRKRMLRAVFSLLGFWVLMFPAALIPPHIPWALACFVAGPFLAYKQWTGEYLVRSFAGRCPRCGSELTIKPGSKIRLPHTLSCFNCHHDPVLEVEGVEREA